MAAMRCKTRAAPADEAFLHPLAGAVWIGPSVASALKIAAGWYVGWPLNIRKTFLQEGELLAPTPTAHAT